MLRSSVWSSMNSQIVSIASSFRSNTRCKSSLVISLYPFGSSINFTNPSTPPSCMSFFFAISSSKMMLRQMEAAAHARPSIGDIISGTSGVIAPASKAACAFNGFSMQRKDKATTAVWIRSSCPLFKKSTNLFMPPSVLILFLTSGSKGCSSVADCLVTAALMASWVPAKAPMDRGFLAHWCICSSVSIFSLLSINFTSPSKSFARNALSNASASSPPSEWKTMDSFFGGGGLSSTLTVFFSAGFSAVFAFAAGDAAGCAGSSLEQQQQMLPIFCICCSTARPFPPATAQHRCWPLFDATRVSASAALIGRAASDSVPCLILHGC
mmetsp:Transcript_21547/g.54327  ORF Transcript_21547/g.54327 Transcript_21547/m.54327 type:complete len:325 (-) Transcript_21547:227-1201(-)